jgi:hypothetical protein
MYGFSSQWTQIYEQTIQIWSLRQNTAFFNQEVMISLIYRSIGKQVDPC